MLLQNLFILRLGNRRYFFNGSLRDTIRTTLVSTEDAQMVAKSLSIEFREKLNASHTLMTQDVYDTVRSVLSRVENRHNYHHLIEILKQKNSSASLMNELKHNSNIQPNDFIIVINLVTECAPASLDAIWKLYEIRFCNHESWALEKNINLKNAHLEVLTTILRSFIQMNDLKIAMDVFSRWQTTLIIFLSDSLKSDHLSSTSLLIIKLITMMLSQLRRIHQLDLASQVSSSIEKYFTLPQLFHYNLPNVDQSIFISHLAALGDYIYLKKIWDLSLERKINLSLQPHAWMALWTSFVLLEDPGRGLSVFHSKVPPNFQMNRSAVNLVLESICSAASFHKDNEPWLSDARKLLSTLLKHPGMMNKTIFLETWRSLLVLVSTVNSTTWWIPPWTASSNLVSPILQNRLKQNHFQPYASSIHQVCNLLVYMYDINRKDPLTLGFIPPVLLGEVANLWIHEPIDEVEQALQSWFQTIPGGIKIVTKLLSLLNERKEKEFENSSTSKLYSFFSRFT